MPRLSKYIPSIEAIQVYSGDNIINPGTMPPRLIQQNVKEHWSRFVMEWIVCFPKEVTTMENVIKFARDTGRLGLFSFNADYFIISYPVQKGTQLRE